MNILKLADLSIIQLEEKVRRMEASDNEEYALWYKCHLYQAKKEYDKVPSIANELIEKYGCNQYKGYLASFYIEYTQDKENWLKAKIIFEELSNTGQDSMAMYLLANMYENGQGVPINKEKALLYYNKSALLDNPHAVLAIGFFYQQGWSVKEDCSEAIDYYLKAYEMGLIKAIPHMIEVYTLQKDYISAIKWINIGIAANNSDSIMLLGTLYEKGQGVRKSWKRAAELYKQSSDMGNDKAQLLYSMMLEDGRGVRKNRYKAYDYICLSASNGNAHAINQINNFSTTLVNRWIYNKMQ
jgi:TPR repeat protein